MKPELDDYKILRMDSHYYVLTPFDLFSLPYYKITGDPFKTSEEAKERREFVHGLDLISYERCQEQGCSFPYND